MSQNPKNIIRKNPKLHKLYQKMYYLLYKRHIYGLTSPLRVLPDFLVIGVVRGGTTSLYDNLSKHPCIFPSAYDELGFFDSNFELGLNWYKSLFPSILRKKISQMKRRCFMTYDVTPQYIYNHDAVKRIADLIPNIKIIALLRNPVDRAYSNYHLGVRGGTEKLTFEDAITAEIKELTDTDSISIKDYNKPRSYVAKGLYANQIKIWFELFARKQILLLSSEDFSEQPNKIMNEIFQFLDLPQYNMINFIKTNTAKYPPMKEETRKSLLDYFRPHNEQLYEIIGKRFDWEK